MSGETADRFLNGRVAAYQPQTGFRSGIDAVFLAAAVPASAGSDALELGSGAGVASLCLAARVAGCEITGVEIDPHLVGLARRNATENGLAGRLQFVAGDVLALPGELKHEFQHVFANPPFHVETGQSSPIATRERSLCDQGLFADWLAAGARRTRSGGTFTVIFRADRLKEALSVLPDGGITLFPLWPKRGEPANRVIAQLRKGARAPLLVLPGMVLHREDGTFAAEAEAVLRDGAALALALP